MSTTTMMILTITGAGLLYILKREWEARKQAKKNVQYRDGQGRFIRENEVEIEVNLTEWSILKNSGKLLSNVNYIIYY